MDAATGQLTLESLGEQLEALGSALRTHIISDINAWEDRQLAEAQAGGNRGQKRGQTKRPRTQQPLPDPPPTTIFGLRRVQGLIYSTPEATGAVSIWVIGILALFVSLADMKGDFRLSDLLGLPATKAAFEMLEFAVESEFVHMSVEAAETALIDRVLATTKDSRAVGWILSQYGVVHGDTFPKCLQMYAIARMAQPMAATGLEAAGLAQAVADLSSAQPESTKKALDAILALYRDTVALATSSMDKAQDILADDSRRFILFYVLQASRHSRGPLVLLDESQASGGWLADAIRFEMRTGFSQFHVCAEDSTMVLRPLAAAIEALYVDTMAGRPKKPSDQPLDFGRVLSAFSFICAVVRGSSSAGRKGSVVAPESGDDVEMTDGAKDDELTLFVASCHACLTRLIAREQELVVLNQMPRTVKNMPQPIPNGLHEAVQKGGRTYNNGPISLPSVGRAEAEDVYSGLFDAMATSGGRRGSANRLFEMACDTVPMLIEILVSRMADMPDLVKRLVQRVVEFWPLHNGEGVVEKHSVRALYRVLLAISEANRGLLLRQIIDVVESALARHHLSPSLLEQLVELLATATSYHYLLAKSPMQVASLLGVREVIGDLRSVLVVCWPHLWKHCFFGDGGATRLQATLVKCLTLIVPLRSMDYLALAEHAVKELVRTQADIARSERTGDCPLELASALLALTSALARHPGVGRVAMEKLLRVILLPAPAFLHPGSSRVNKEQLDAVFEVGDDDGDEGSPRKRPKPGLLGSSWDSGLDLGQLLDGSVLPRAGDQKGAVAEQESLLAKAQTMLWQNAVRPMPRYPRSALHSHDRTKDAWAFARPATTSKPGDGDGSTRPLLVFGLLSLAHTAPSGVSTLCELLEEYYIDCLPSMPPHLLDERLSGCSGCSGTRLQLRSIEMELVQDIRENSDLEHVLFNLVSSGSVGALGAKRLVSALLIALVVLWNGALGEPTTRRERDLKFTSRLVAHIVEAYGDGRSSARLCDLFPMISGGDLARLLHQYVWRWIVHRMPSAEDESQRLLQHIMRRYVVNAAPLFKCLAAVNN